MSTKRTWEIQVQAVRAYCAMFTVEAATAAEAQVRAKHVLENCNGHDLGVEWEPFDEDPDMLRDAKIISIQPEPSDAGNVDGGEGE